MNGERLPQGWLVAGVVAIAALLGEKSALAETWEAPAGGHAVLLGNDRVTCPGSLEAGWAVEQGGRAVRPPSAEDTIGKLIALRVAATEQACATGGAVISLVALGPRPTADALTLDADAGRVLVQGRKLRGSVLAWTTRDGRLGSDTCVQPQTTAAVDTCAFSVPRDLPPDADAVTFAVLPPGGHVVPDRKIFDAAGRALPDAAFNVRPTEIDIQRLLLPDPSLDLSSGTGRVTLLHPEAVASASCVDATCDVDGRDLVVRGERGGDDNLEVHFQLRPHVVQRSGGVADGALVVNIPLQRCPVSVAQTAVLSEADGERVVLRIDGSCAKVAGDLNVSTGGGPAQIERTETIAGALYAVVRVPRIEGDSLVATVRRRGTILGTAHAPARRFVWHTRLELEGHGPIDFIPTNRWAKVLVPGSPHGTAVEVRAVDGVYETKRDPTGAGLVRGIEGASGAAPLRLALVDASLPAPLLGLTIAEASESVNRAIRVANVPVGLGAAVRAKEPLAELVCDDGRGHPKAVPPSTTTSIAFRARDTCQLILHRERLAFEDGAQRLQLAVHVSAFDGVARNEAQLDEKLVVRRADKPLYVAIAGATAPFDRIGVRLGNDAEVLGEEGADTATSGVTRAPQAQWSVVTGTSHARIYGTTAIPTGLFRIADTGHSGILTLSAGALLRLVALSRDGVPFPLGLEAGVMWLGIAGDPTVSAGGVVAVVAGPGIAVPIANASRASQTAISLHAWFEYEVSREVLHQQGQAFGFVFGPSISIGDVGTNF